jgi:hypothetical protein
MKLGKNDAWIIPLCIIVAIVGFVANYYDKLDLPLLITLWVAELPIGALLHIITREKKEKQAKEISVIDKSNFRNQVQNEIISILEGMNNVIVVGVGVAIPYSVWNSITDYEKIELLGDDDYQSINAFYHTIDESNRITRKGDIPNALTGASYQSIIREAERIFREISWLRPKENELSDLFSTLNRGTIYLLETRYSLNITRIVSGIESSILLSELIAHHQ